MKLSEKYFFSDFTRSNYIKLLRLAKKKYTFTSYNELNLKTKTIIWRHDIDFSARSAEEIAEIERAEGIKSTYFILLHGEFYNLLDKENTCAVKRIIELGHDIGLHFDINYYGITDKTKLENYLRLERIILEKIFQIPIRSFAFHITNELTKRFQNKSYAGLNNTYSDYYQKFFDYCSDSNGYWRFRRLEDVLVEAKSKRLHVLTHPAYWQDKELSPKRKLWNIIRERAEATKKWHKHTTIKYGRKYI